MPEPRSILSVETIAAYLETTPQKLLIAFSRIAVAGYIVDLGHGIRVTVEPLPSNLAQMVAEAGSNRETRQILMALFPPTTKRVQ